MWDMIYAAMLVQQYWNYVQKHGEIPDEKIMASFIEEAQAVADYEKEVSSIIHLL